jgi:hypothetical protein
VNWIWITVIGFGVSVALWIAAAVVTVWLAMSRGGAFIKWAVLGVLLGPFGLWLAVNHVRPCPQCGRSVLNEVPVCPFCGFDIPRQDPVDNPVGPLWSYRKDW